MANVQPPGVGAGGAPPAGLPVPAAPQLPFAASPRTITGWLSLETAECTADSIADEIEAITERYGRMPDPLHADYDNALKDLASDSLVTDDLSCYLSVSKAQGQTPMVSAVLGLARYSAGMGGMAAYQGKVMGFLGEVIGGDQLPTLMMVPDTPDQRLVDLLELGSRQVPTSAQLEAAFAGTTPPSVMSAPNGAAESVLARIMFVPKAWAMYFMDRKTPFQAFKMMEQLTATLPEQQQRDKALPLLEWCKAACVRAGAGATARRNSQLHVPWETPDLAERRLVIWAKKQLAPYRSEIPIAVAPVAGMPALAPQMFAAGGVLQNAVKNYTIMEHDKIRGACTLKVAEYDVYVPPIFAEFLSEGRTTERVQSVLQVRLKPDVNSDHPVSIYVSRDMAKDIKDLRFGYGGAKDYESCHRGVSPFAVVPVSAEAASFRRRAQERASRVSLMTSEDAREMETSPGVCPTTYDALQRVLLAYQTFLRIIFGGYCDHYLEVVRIRRTLSQRVDEFAGMGPSDVAGLLWAIFCDARDFFSTLPENDDLPKSNLHVTWMFLNTGSFHVPFHVPTGRLLGWSRQNPGAPTGQGIIGGGGAASTNLGGASDRTGGGEPPWVSKAKPNESFLLAVQPAVAKDPEVRVVDLMDAHVPKLRYKDFKAGSPGTCLDMVIMGVCNRRGCGYSHKYCEVISADKTAKLCAILKKCVTGFVSA